jgi:hypothetical protein
MHETCTRVSESFDIEVHLESGMENGVWEKGLLGLLAALWEKGSCSKSVSLATGCVNRVDGKLSLRRWNEPND